LEPFTGGQGGSAAAGRATSHYTET
jgi:hypothetical protein